MFHKTSPTEESYLSWLKRATSLPVFCDYFDFVKTYENLDQRRANRNYMNVMRRALMEAKGETAKARVAGVIELFNERENNGSAFGQKYKQHWESREATRSQERISKRQRITAEEGNEVVCSTFKKIMEKVAAAALGSVNETPSTSSRTANNTTNSTANNTSNSASSSTSNNTFNSEANDDLDLLEEKTYEELSEKFIYVDNGDSSSDSSITDKVRQLNQLPTFQLSNECQKLLKLIEDSAPSPIIIRNKIRSNEVEGFDLAVHSDVNFVEVLGTHFVNMYQSPRNPLQQQQLERNAAFMITIPILHNLFIGCNDIIDLQWIEKQAPSTGETKWDGVAFMVNNKRVTPLFIELSGGISFNSGPEKERSDEEKMIEHFIPLLKVQKANGVDTPIQYYTRYHNMKIHFESLSFYDTCF